MGKIVVKNPRDKREKFVDLAEARVTKALDSIRVIGNLSNRALYEYSESDVSKIIGALNAEVTELKRKFTAGGPRQRPTFKL